MFTLESEHEYGNNTLAEFIRQLFSIPLMTPNSPAVAKQRHDPARGPADALPHVTRGDSLYAQGRFESAFKEFQFALACNRADPDTYFRLASTAWKLDLRPEVEQFYLQAIKLDPKFAQAHQMFARWLLTQQRAEAALEHTTAAIAISPNDEETVITHSVALTANGQWQLAYDCLRPILQAGRASWHLASALADVAGKVDQRAQAVALIDRTLLECEVAPVLARKLRVSAASLSVSLGRHVDAFEQMRRAKELVTEKFDPIGRSAWVTNSNDYLSRQKMDALPRATHQNARPVLIVGMPRSGTSLIEQILSSHPAIHGAGELRALGAAYESLLAADWTEGLAYPQCLDTLSIRRANELANGYLLSIASAPADAIYVTDKMPQNFEHLGLAEVLLPDCHVIHCQRDPRDTCLSCYLTDFDHGHAFTCDLEHLASFYRDYQRQMAHWKSVLSLPILDVRYEDVVADAEGQTRRMLDFLKLPWADSCLSFHENRRQVATASKDQVRQPLYKTSVQRWKRYEKNLGPLLDLVDQ